MYSHTHAQQASITRPTGDVHWTLVSISIVSCGSYANASTFYSPGQHPWFRAIAWLVIVGQVDGNCLHTSSSLPRK